MGWVDNGFVMFLYPAWAVGLYSSGPLAGGTPQIQVHPTHVAERMNNPVDRLVNKQMKSPVRVVAQVSFR